MKRDREGGRERGRGREREVKLRREVVRPWEARSRYPARVGADYKLVLHIFQLRKSRLAGERNILAASFYTLSPSLCPSYPTLLPGRTILLKFHSELKYSHFYLPWNFKMRPSRAMSTCLTDVSYRTVSRAVRVHSYFYPNLYSLPVSGNENEKFFIRRHRGMSFERDSTRVICSHVYACTYARTVQNEADRRMNRILETERNETKRNETKRNETKRNERIFPEQIFTRERYKKSENVFSVWFATVFFFPVQ